MGDDITILHCTSRGDGITIMANLLGDAIKAHKMLGDHIALACALENSGCIPEAGIALVNTSHFTIDPMGDGNVDSSRCTNGINITRVPNFDGIPVNGSFL